MVFFVDASLKNVSGKPEELRRSPTLLDDGKGKSEVWDDFLGGESGPF